MRRGILFTLIVSTALVFLSASPTMRLTVGVAQPSHLTTTISLQGSPGGGAVPGSPGGGHGGNGYVCSQSGLPGGASATLSGGELTLSYAGHSVGSSMASLLSAWNSYKDCVTTASDAPPQISCSLLHDASHAGDACSFTLKAEPVKWGSQQSGSPGGVYGGGIPSMISSCAASLQNPTITVSTPSIASMSYYPTKTWLMNLPVEYTYTEGAIPTPHLSGQLSNNCSTTLNQQPILLNEPGLTAAHQYAYEYQSAYGSASLSVTGLTAGTPSPGPAYVNMVLADNPSQLVASLPACSAPHQLIPPSSLPRDTGELAAYSTLYAEHGICTVTPSAQSHESFQSVAINKQPIIFELSQDWTVNATYYITGSTTTTYSGYTAVYSDKTGRLVRIANSYTDSYPQPYQSGPITGTANVQSTEFKSKPIRVDYVTGNECSLVGQTVTCPQ